MYLETPVTCIQPSHTLLQTYISAHNFLDTILGLKSLWEVSVLPTLENYRL